MFMVHLFNYFLCVLSKRVDLLKLTKLIIMDTGGCKQNFYYDE